MRNYEAVFILSPRLAKNEVQKLAEELKQSIEAANGKNLVEVKVEKRPLFYSIKKQKEGIYVIYRFTAPPDAIAKIKADFKHNESVLRYSFLVINEKEEPKPGKSEKEE